MHGLTKLKVIENNRYIKYKQEHECVDKLFSSGLL